MMMNKDNGSASTKRSLDWPGDDATTGLACLVMVARFHGLATDPAQIKHRFHKRGAPMSAVDMVRALKETGLKARLVKSSWRRFAHLQLPAILERKDGTFCVLAKVSDDKALLQCPGEGRATPRSREQVEQLWSGRVILITRRLFKETPRNFGIGWFISTLLKYRSIMWEVTLASFFIQTFALVTPLVFMIVIDKVLTHRALSTLDVLVFALAAVAVFEVILTALRAYLLSHTTNRIDVELGVRLFRHLMALPLDYFNSRRVGDSVARIRELEVVRNFLTGSALTLILDLFFAVVFLAVMFLFSPFLTMIVIGALPIFLLISVVMTPMLRGKLNDKFNLGAENQAFMVEALTGIETLKNTAAEPHMQRHWEERLASYVSAAFASGKLANITNQAISFISKGLVVLLLWLGARLVMDGALTVGQLIAFNMLALRVNAPILRIAQIWQEFQQMRVSVRRLADILDAPTEPTFSPGRATPPPIKGQVSFDGVGFRYRSDASEALSDVSFEVNPGQVVGIVGPSGSGKTTLVKLIQRLYVPDRGRVLIDGTNLNTVDTSWLRRQIGVVSQDSVLFNRSVRENIAFADPSIEMERIVAVAVLSGAHEFITELADGYETIIGERGCQLSGGQRQRIAIARALLPNPRLLILDEATNELDYESERIIRENMQRICEGRTVFIVAHRLSTVRHCDRILTLDRGRLVEQGDHVTLLENGGRYSTLYRSQDSHHVRA
jgi:ATP-binding cassette, subfamily B, bacterial HlyB/CyaB